MGLFGSLFDVVENTVKIAAAPVEAVVELANAVLEPVAEAVEEIVSDIKSIKD
jgi:hypothetical protein